MADRSILVVDDNEINRGILGEIFKDKYNMDMKCLRRWGAEII